jgi:uncharacterized membrane protein
MTLQNRHCEEAFSADEAIFFAIIYFSISYLLTGKIASLHRTFPLLQFAMTLQNRHCEEAFSADEAIFYAIIYFSISYLLTGKIASLHRTFPLLQFAMTLQNRHCEEAFPPTKQSFLLLFYFQFVNAMQERLLHSIAHSPSSVRNDAAKSSLRGGFFSRRSNLFCYYILFNQLSHYWKDCFTPPHNPFFRFAMTNIFYFTNGNN